MSLARIASALVLSLGLHLAAVGLLRGHSPVLGLTTEPRPTAEVPLTILGGGRGAGTGTETRSVDRRSAGDQERGGRVLRSAEGGGVPRGLPRVPSASQLLAIAGGEVAVVEGSGAGGTEGALGTMPIPGGSGDSAMKLGHEAAGPGSGLSPAIDLQPFVDRLRRSAERCGSVAPRGRAGRAQSRVGLVRFCVAPDGAPTALSLVESTGDPALDRAALECIVPGSAPLPAADRCLVVPLRFH